MMKRNVFVLMLLLAVCATAAGQRRAPSRTTPGGQRQGAAVSVPLPAADALMFVELRRLLSEAVPRALAGDAERLAQVNADIERFKTRTGIDARQVERVAVVARFTSPRPDVTKLDHVVAAANGTFDEAAIAAAGRASSGGHREMKHAGKTVHVFTLNERVKMFGVMPGLQVRELAVSLQDASLLFVGEPEAVRAAIDAAAGRAPRVSATLTGLARRNPEALVGFGSNAPPTLAKMVEGLSPEVERSVASIRQIYGSAGMNESGFNLLLNLRAATAADAAKLVETINALKAVAAFYTSQRSDERGRVMQRALDNLRLAPQGNEAQLRLDVPQTDLPTILRVF